jgi:Methyltransferase domain
MVCKICNNPSEKIFEKIILQEYNSGYYKCTSCSFVQTDEPIWLSKAYESAITSLDIGLLSRNIHLKNEISLLIDICFPEATKMIDYAGGYGVFVRIMRDSGYDFYREDQYCENIFAKHFDITDTAIQKFDLVTAFEVLEHFSNPLVEIENVFKYADTAIFSTEITPATNSEIENWWYITQETGQHIAFYSTKAMEIIAKKFNKNYYCKNGNIHIFSKDIIDQDKIDLAINNITKKKYFFGLLKKRIHKKLINRDSLQQNDFHYIKNSLNSKS